MEPLCPFGSAPTVVRAYYTHAVHYSPAGVRACFAPALAATLSGNGSYAPWNNYLSARLIAMRVHSVPPSFLYDRTHPSVRVVKLVQILVSVVTHYRRIGRTPLHNGQNDLFFYLGQELRGSPWRIVAIGTGG